MAFLMTRKPAEKLTMKDFFAHLVLYMRRICVAVKITPQEVLVRDTKDPSKTTLKFNHEEWKAFIEGVKNGEFNV